MNAIEKAAFQLDLKSLKDLKPTPKTIAGALLCACSAHDPDSKAQVKMILYLLKMGADINEMDKNGVTPLHRAVRFRSPVAARLLIEKGADINCQDRKTLSTPLHRAVTHTGAPGTKGKTKEMEELVQILVGGGAKVGLKNKMGKTPIEYIKDEALLRLVRGK